MAMGIDVVLEKIIGVKGLLAPFMDMKVRGLLACLDLKITIQQPR
jgi:hypothetical protein